MGVNAKNDFVLESKGRCFLCLDKTTIVKHEQESTAPPFSKHPFHYVSRYLKMDLRKVFNNTEQIPPYLLAKVESSRLKVELCEECVKLTEQFFEIYRKLEKVEIELGSCLRQIHAKLLDPSVAGKLEGEFKKLTNVEPQLQLSSGGELEILEVLREEAFQKSRHKLFADVPHVKLVNLSRKRIRAEKLKFTINTKRQKTLHLPSNILTPDMAGSSPKSDRKASGSQMKLEPNDLPLGDDNDNRQPDDFNEPNEAMYEGIEDTTLTMTEEESNSNTGHDSSPVVASIPKPFVETKTKFGTGMEIPNCSINPETGKYRCDTCAMEFATKCGFKFHYESVHLKVRYKCVTCGKQFSDRSACSRHQKSAHVGLRYACQVCNKSFTQTGHVRKHQRMTECGNKLGLKSTPV